MKNRIILIVCKLIIILLFGGTIFSLLFPWLYWNFSSSTPLNVWILDKTVPTSSFREHKGLMWILNHFKVTYKLTQKTFRYDEDYYGYFPEADNKYYIKKLPEETVYPELMYITDTYGVYIDDVTGNNFKGTRSSMIYGGLTENEVLSLTDNLGHDNTIIGEFNSAKTPTETNVQLMYGKIFEIKWGDWIGRYFNNLSKDLEVPIWMVLNYEKQYEKKWNFNGAGVVLVSYDDRIVVLEDKVHLGKKNVTLIYEEASKTEFNVNDDIPYRYWFEIISPGKNTEVLAKYNFDLTPEGKKVFEELGLDTIVPAITRKKATDFTSYYFAGDFADNDKVGTMWYLSGYNKFQKYLATDTKVDMDYFFWKAYVPMMEKIIDDIKLLRKGR